MKRRDFIVIAGAVLATKKTTVALAGTGTKRSTVQIAPITESTEESPGTTTVATGCPEIDVAPCYPASETEGDWTTLSCEPSFTYAPGEDLDYSPTANYDGDIFWPVTSNAATELGVARWDDEQDLNVNPDETDYVETWPAASISGYDSAWFEAGSMFFSKWPDEDGIYHWGVMMGTWESANFYSKPVYWDNRIPGRVFMQPDPTYPSSSYYGSCASFGPNGDIYIMAVEFEETAGWNRIIISKNGDPPIQVAGWNERPGEDWNGYIIPQNRVCFAIDVDAFGTIHCVGSKQPFSSTHTPPGSVMYYTYSTDDGATWAPEQITPYTNGEYNDYPNNGICSILATRFGRLLISAPDYHGMCSYTCTSDPTANPIVWDVTLSASNRWVYTGYTNYGVNHLNGTAIGGDPCGCRLFVINHNDGDSDYNASAVPAFATLIENGTSLGLDQPLVEMPHTFLRSTGTGAKFNIQGRADFGITVICYAPQNSGFFKKVFTPN